MFLRILNPAVISEALSKTCLSLIGINNIQGRQQIKLFGAIFDGEKKGDHRHINVWSFLVTLSQQMCHVEQPINKQCLPNQCCHIYFASYL